MQIQKVDIITAGMGYALATTGGFCTGSAKVVDHQVCVFNELSDFHLP
jgi:7-keto-8-aminopelargonate synthetase-like enzyme